MTLPRAPVGDKMALHLSHCVVNCVLDYIGSLLIIRINLRLPVYDFHIFHIFPRAFELVFFFVQS